MVQPETSCPDVSFPVTLDGFLGGRLQVFQPQRGHRAGIDAIFLAAAIPAASGDTALELGTGVGVAALALACRVAGVDVTGIEIEPEQARLAHVNAARNGLAASVRVHVADVCGLAGRGTPEALCGRRFDHVFANPPFYERGRAQVATDPLKAGARALGAGELDQWIRTMTALAANGASLTLIHLPERLAELLAGLDRRAGNVKVYPLFPHEGRPASRIIVQATKGSRAPLSVLPGMVLHRPGGGFTARAEAILRHGEPLDIGS